MQQIWIKCTYPEPVKNFRRRKTAEYVEYLLGQIGVDTAAIASTVWMDAVFLRFGYN